MATNKSPSPVGESTFVGGSPRRGAGTILFNGFLFKVLLKALVFVGLSLVLFGVFSLSVLVFILIAFVALRWLALVCEAAFVSSSGAGGMAARRRSGYELIAEALGAAAFAMLLPLTFALYTRDFFSLRMGLEWGGALVVAVCLVLYTLPHVWLKEPELSEVRIGWWALPFAFGLLAVIYALNTRHVYLNPIARDHNRLAAERVLALKNNVVAGAHADWVLRYARELDRAGDLEKAIQFYRAGLRLDPNRREDFERLARIEAASVNEQGATADASLISTTAPYWSASNPVIRPPRHSVDSGLENVEACTVVIVPVGDVPSELLDAAGCAVHRELGLPVYVSPDAVPLPERGRVRGLAVGPQWDATVLAQAFLHATGAFPKAPIRYVLITTADIYMENANFVFSISYDNWGAVVSSARYSHPDKDVLAHRTAKQTLCALLKSFKIPPSPDRECVTSYTRSLEEFDLKGNRPNAETLKQFRRSVAEINSIWEKFKPRRLTSLPHS